MAYPKTYRYTKEHEWINVEGGLATIGITDYAQHEGRRSLRRAAQARSENRIRKVVWHGGVRKGSQRDLRAGCGGSDRSQWRTSEYARENQYRSAWCGVADQSAPDERRRTQRADGRCCLRRLHPGQG